MSRRQGGALVERRPGEAPPSVTPGRSVRIGPASFVLRPRVQLVLTAVGALCALALVVSVALGDVPLAPGDVVGILLGGGEGGERFVVLGLRLPRALVGLLVGFALGVAGAITQSVTRNPLASPDVLGITGGASVGAVAMIVMAPTAGAVLGVPAAALLGGVAAAVAVYTLAWRGGVDGFRLVLVGIGIGAFCTSLVTWLLVRAEINDAATATVWLTGSLNGRGWDQVPAMAVTVGVAVVLAAPLTRYLRAMSLGEDSALALGVRLHRARLAVLLLAVVLASMATAAAGPVPFVALVAPQVAIRLTGTPEPPLLTSGAVGAGVLTAADLVARTALPVQLPAGVITALIGAPFLIYLLRRRTREATA